MINIQVERFSFKVELAYSISGKKAAQVMLIETVASAIEGLSPTDAFSDALPHQTL